MEPFSIQFQAYVNVGPLIGRISRYVVANQSEKSKIKELSYWLESYHVTVNNQSEGLGFVSSWLSKLEKY